ncbi:MAG: cyanoexosortase A system-associated protein [Coleofasciculaceae cyanobacterium]
MIKTINRWEIFRISILVTTASSVFFVLLKSFLSPSFTGAKVAALVFPATVPLKEWQQITSPSLDIKKDEISKEDSAKSYRYIQNNLFLDIEMHYLPSSDGNVLKLVKLYDQLGASQISPDIRQQPEIGHYGLFTHQNKASLSACINSQRNSTFKAEQFVQNQLNVDVISKRFIPWLFSGESLRDRRCLLVKLSVPLDNYSAKDAYLILEQAWFNWYQWWQPRLPS